MFALVLTGSLSFVAWAYLRTNYPIRNAPVAGQKIVAFGDRLVADIGATSTGGFVNPVAWAIQRPIVNAGASQDTTATALARLDALLERERPDLVIVQLGGNDLLQRVPMEQTIGNLREIISKIQARRAAVLLLNFRGNIFDDPYRRALGQLARATQTAYLPNVLDDIWGNEYLMTDASHPNDRGYGIMAIRVARAVKELLGSP